jgi:ATP adenylyltransferase/5',5'''-P-1,P-4-tetraphosphate phosphorylase II
MSIPFQHYISSILDEKSSESLYHIYRHLLFDLKRDNQEEEVSYNFVMTMDWIFLSPRTMDDYTDTDQRIAVNSTGMVGLLLTKSDEQTEFVERVRPLSILASVGKPWSQNARVSDS